jgi:hypothetical protein
MYCTVVIAVYLLFKKLLLQLLSLLLLWGGIVQGVPCTATIFDLLCIPI